MFLLGVYMENAVFAGFIFFVQLYHIFDAKIVKMALNTRKCV